MVKEVSYLESCDKKELVEGRYVQKNFFKNLVYTLVLTSPLAIFYDLGILELFGIAVYAVIRNEKVRHSNKMELPRNQTENLDMLADYSIEDFL
jgi:hypothetical protein